MTRSKGKRMYMPRAYNKKYVDTPEAKRLREYRQRWRDSRITGKKMILYKRGRKSLSRK